MHSSIHRTSGASYRRESKQSAKHSRETRISLNTVKREYSKWLNLCPSYHCRTRLPYLTGLFSYAQHLSYFSTSAEVVSSSAGTPNSISIPFKWVLFLCVRWTRCTLFGSLFEFYSSRMWRLAEKLLIATKKKRKALILLTNSVLFFSFLPSPE